MPRLRNGPSGFNPEVPPSPKGLEELGSMYGKGGSHHFLVGTMKYMIHLMGVGCRDNPYNPTSSGTIPSVHAASYIVKAKQ